MSSHHRSFVKAIGFQNGDILAGQSTEISNNGSVIEWLLHPFSGSTPAWHGAHAFDATAVRTGRHESIQCHIPTVCKQEPICLHPAVSTKPQHWEMDQQEPCSCRCQGHAGNSWCQSPQAAHAFPLGPHASQGPSHELLPAMLRRCVSPHQPC